MADKERRLAITIKGGVSLGAYEAGAITELLELIAHNNRSGGTPWYIDTLAGASAGAITAALLARVLINTGPMGDDRSAAIDALRTIWVDDLSVDRLTRAGSTDNSILDSAAVQRLADRYLGAQPTAARRHPAMRPGEARIGLVFTLSALGVDPEQVPARNGLLTYHEYAATARFDVRIGADQTVAFSAKGIAPYDHQADDRGRLEGEEAYLAMIRAAIASGAFPLAFAPHGLASFEDSEWTDRYFVDGGVYDNDPVGKTIALAHETDWGPESSAFNDSERRFLVIHTEPFPHPEPWPPAEMDRRDLLDLNPLDLAGQFIPGFLEESKTSGLRGIGKINQRIDERSKILSDLISVLTKTAGTFDFTSLRRTLRFVVDRVAKYQGLDRRSIDLIRENFIDDLSAVRPNLRRRALHLGDRRDARGAFVELGLLVDLSAKLCDKVPFQPIVIAPVEPLAGNPIGGFSGFFLRELRLHDFVQGRADALRAMHDIGEADFKFDPAHRVDPPVQMTRLTPAQRRRYNRASAKFEDRVTTVVKQAVREGVRRSVGLPFVGQFVASAVTPLVRAIISRFVA